MLTQCGHVIQTRNKKKETELAMWGCLCSAGKSKHLYVPNPLNTREKNVTCPTWVKHCHNDIALLSLTPAVLHSVTIDTISDHVISGISEVGNQIRTCANSFIVWQLLPEVITSPHLFLFPLGWFIRCVFIHFRVAVFQLRWQKRVKTSPIELYTKETKREKHHELSNCYNLYVRQQ